MSSSPFEITVYTRNNCAACIGTKAAFTSRGIPITEVNIQDKDNEGVAQELVDEGWRGMPVVKVRDEEGIVIEKWQGADPQKIREIANLMLE